MQSFRERSGGYHTNQACYQQEPHELSRLETYRQHPHHPHPQHAHPGPGPHPSPGPGPQQQQHARPGYDAHPLATPAVMPSSGAPGSGGAQKECYSQQSYPGYPGSSSGNGGSVAPQAKKPYRGSKVPPPPPSQHLQGPSGYSNHIGPGSYSAQYMAEGHIQQKWEDPGQLTQYEQELVGRMEPGAPPTPGSSQYMEQNMHGHSQGQCHQPSNPVYTSPHHQTHPSNPVPSPLMYPQSHLHYPQHSPSPSPYMDKCSPMPHCYKGYNMPSNSQYSRQMSSHPSLKQAGYRPSQNSYSYQQPPSRGYESQPPLQAMPSTQESHSKYYGQPQQNYCLSELSVRSPEQYYQTCSPSSSHSPARSVGRSPSYSSTPSPLMTNPESFQYGQPPMTPGAASSSSSSSAAMQDQGSSTSMLMPPRSHPSPNVPHVASQSYTTTSQGPTMKERFSEKLLSNPSLWSLNALTSQVENISNNVQQLLLSEALVANKKGKRSSGGSNSSVGSVGSSKKGEEYKSPPYPDGGGSGVGGGPMQDPYSTPHHQPLPMELHEGGYSSSSDEQLERGYYYCSQGRSPAQPPNNTQLSLDTGSSCSMTSPDDMSTRSGDSGLHNLTPDPRYQSGQGSDGISTPAKSIGDERSPTCMSIHSPLKQERDSPPDIQRISEHVKENFEESAWTEKLAEEEEATLKQNPELKESSVDSPEKLDKWSEDEKGPSLYTKINEGVTEKSFCYDETVYQGIQRKYDPDSIDSVEQSPAAHSISSHKGHIEHEMKSEAFKSESPTASESSVKTSPFISRGDLERDQYYTEKDDSSESNSLSPNVEVLDGVNEEKKESRDEDMVEDEADEREQEVDEEEEENIQPQLQQHSLSPPLSVEVSDDMEEGRVMTQPLTEEKINYRAGPEGPSGDSCSRSKVTEPHTDAEPMGTSTHRDAASTTVISMNASERESAIGDMHPQPQSAMPVFSVLNDKAQSRDHMDHSDAKVLEPDSPQLPGKSILPPAPSWADTPPSPKKGDEDMEPGISCPSAVTPSAKPEPVATSAQPRAFERKHARGRRRVMHSGVGIRRQLSLEREDEKEDEAAPLPEQKPCIAPSKTVLFSDQMDLAHQESILSQTPKSLVEGFRSRMCTRSFNAPDIPTKIEANAKRKPGPKPSLKPGAKAGPKPGVKAGAKPGAKPGPKPGPKPAVKSGTKPGPKPGPKPAPKPVLKPEPNLPDLSLEVESPVKRKPGPKPGSKTGSKPALKLGSKPGSKPGPNPAEALPPNDAIQIKATVGRPKGSISKAKLIQKEEVTLASVALPLKGKKNLKATMLQTNLDTNEPKQEHNDDTKASEKDNKNMVLRSRKPSIETPLKEKLTVLEEDVVQGPTEIQTSDSLNIEELSSIEQNLTSFIPITDENNTDISISSPALLTPPPHNTVPDESILACLKRKACPESPSMPAKKKRGPKPKPKLPPFENTILEQALPEPKVKVVRGPKRKRGPQKKTLSLNIPQTKETAPPVVESDTVSDVPPAAPQCPTKTKVLPPRKGRGQKYEAMVQKIASPSSKKHLPMAQIESTPIEDTAAKVSSQHGLRESETSAIDSTETSPIDSNKMVEGPLKTSEVRDKNISKEEVEVDNEEVTQKEQRQELKQNESTSEGVRQDVRNVSLIPEEVRPDNTDPEEKCREEQIESQGTLVEEVSDRMWGSADTGAQAEWMQESSAGVPELAAKPARTKRKRWALVESTDASVINMEAGSLIVTTPRLAKQRAIKNNHEMHLKQKRKRRKGQASTEDGEEVEETSAEVADQPPPPPEDESETKATPPPTEPSVPVPIGPDTMNKPSEVTTTEPIQKPKRGRKPSADPSHKKRGKAPSEQIPGKPVKVHKKPGPKPGMKDAMEVIEAVVRAAGCEQTEKEEREKQEREKREKEKGETEEEEKPHQCIAVPVFTVSNKRAETISMKRIRRKPVEKQMNPCFRPHVRINNSRDFSSWCAIINSPEEATPLKIFKKKRMAKMKNPITVAKVVPHTMAMLQGPLVNKTLIDRCLTCCLCGKPSNYRDLGDLCGPYYTEDSMPRKILSSRHLGGFSGVPPKADDSSSNNNNSSSSSVEEASGSSTSDRECSTEKEGSPEASAQEGTSSSSSSSSGHHHWRHRRPEGILERSGREGGPRRLTLRERFRRMKRLLDIERGEATAANSDQGAGGSHGCGSFQRLREEAEANEHWAHENCTIWTKGVIMVAGRLYGLTEAARNSTQTNCYKCQTMGASLSCCWGGCSRRYHYACAKEIGCTFHEVDFSITCPKHEEV